MPWIVLPTRARPPEYLEVFDQHVTRDAWEVLPAVMLEVYPELVTTGAAWSERRGSGARTRPGPTSPGG